MFWRLELGNGEEKEKKNKERKKKKRKQKRGERMTKEEEKGENDNGVIFETHTKMLFIVHWKFKYNWVACILYGNPKMWIEQKS